MASPMQLLNEWEVQLLVLLSYMLQAFLFFAGGLRQRSCNKFFRFLVWIAYLGADLVAAYALGLISRHDDYASGGSRETDHQLVFLWAPFLLIHLGGQDTITAFSLEDNNLWLRHLLNLVVQLGLVMYIFWKSASSGTNAQLLAPSILVCVTGAIKYAERTWALWSGVLKNLSDHRTPHYAQQLEQALWRVEQIDEDRTSSSKDEGVLWVALCSITIVLTFFWHDESCGADAGAGLPWFGEHCPPKLLDILDTELGLAYDYIYTKSVVFQTKSGIILRCISQASFVAAFLVFLFVSNKHRHDPIDTAVTYTLFLGGFCLEVFAAFTRARSPWTWAWLKARQCSFLASLFVRWQRKRVFWSNSMGQYNMDNYLGRCDDQSTISPWKQGMMSAVNKVVSACCGHQQQFWVSKLLDIKHIVVDKELMRCIFDKVVEYGQCVEGDQQCLPQQWPNLGALLQKVVQGQGCASIALGQNNTLDWNTITILHIYTEVQLRLYSPSRQNDDDADLVRKISRYIVYLLATQPRMLPVSRNAEASSDGSSVFGVADFCAQLAASEDIFARFEVPAPHSCTKEHLLETKEAWIRILIFIAGRSLPELHATQLCRGGELLTFVWLFMAHRGLGDSALQRIEATDAPTGRKRLVLFHVSPQQTTDQASEAQG